MIDTTFIRERYLASDNDFPIAALCDELDTARKEIAKRDAEIAELRQRLLTSVDEKYIRAK